MSTTYNNARNGNRKVAVRVDDADHGSSNTAVAELRTVVPDGVGIIDGDNKGHVRWGGHVAGVDAVRGRMAWLAEAGLRDRVVLFDDTLMLALSSPLRGTSSLLHSRGNRNISVVSDLHHASS